MRIAEKHTSEDDLTVSRPLTVKIFNDLNFGVSLDWLNFEGVPKACFAYAPPPRMLRPCPGDRVHYAIIDPGESHRQRTFTLHPWRLGFAIGDDELAVVLFEPHSHGETVRVSDAIRLADEDEADGQG